ncbi:XRE family transcriptional regulator [Hoeflea marina]|uniref:XRE family transcriptional regulator n=1 Tax=Hoeflea marina TaxID=274592 RepID=A0A317PE02_9HYPH|nr:XRE family transcriptional regulator [Hoeflea marina]PWV97769.1 XRE family transcriptional regulator [Hoeflea marina]
MSIKSQLGIRLKTLRKARTLTLMELAALSHVSASTISKIENGALSPTLDLILKLCEGLNVSISQLVSESDETAGGSTAPNGRFSPARRDEGVLIDTANYDYLYLCSELKNKRMVPIRARLKARSMQQFGPLFRHGGEEFLYVLEGAVEVHSEFYAPIALARGEGVYLDSTMGHAYLSTSDTDAEILCICTEAELPQGR